VKRLGTEAVDERGEITFEGFEVEIGATLLARHHQHCFGEELRVVAGEGKQEQDQHFSQLRPELPHHPQIEEVDLLAGPDQIAWVRIGVEEPVDQDLAVERLE
jgi:hypothetical protein